MTFYSPLFLFSPIVLLVSMLLGSPSIALPLSPGDRIRVLIPEGELFSGVYEVNLDGNIEIPYLPRLPVVGKEVIEVQAELYQILIQQQFFQPRFLKVSITPLRWAPIQVNVKGETFQSGRVLINNRSAEDRAQQITQSTGDYPPDRFLSAALRAAGGITPEADIANVTVSRHDRKFKVDLTGIFRGEKIEDFPLVAGDQIEVPRLLKPNEDWVRPSQITPPGIQVFLSNLTIPADSNAQSAINRDSTSFAYGARFSQAVVAANCAGGTNPTNAQRHAVLVRTNRLTGKTTTLDRPVEDLLRRSTNNENNPFLLPFDGVACYDSTVTDIRDVARSIADIINPFRLIFGGN